MPFSAGEAVVEHQLGGLAQGQWGRDHLQRQEPRQMWVEVKIGYPNSNEHNNNE
jgi:myo-inositol catabolism protein IolC